MLATTLRSSLPNDRAWAASEEICLTFRCARYGTCRNRGRQAWGLGPILDCWVPKSRPALAPPLGSQPPGPQSPLPHGQRCLQLRAALQTWLRLVTFPLGRAAGGKVSAGQFISRKLTDYLLGSGHWS